MCLITLDPNPKVAEEDIPVWKVLEKGNTGFYRLDYKYKHGRNYPADTYDEGSGIERGYDGTYEVRGGWLHAIKRSARDKKCITKYFCLKKGIFTASRNSRAVKMYIPKGTEYIEDKNGRDICARCLVWPWFSM